MLIIIIIIFADVFHHKNLKNVFNKDNKNTMVAMKLKSLIFAQLN